MHPIYELNSDTTVFYIILALNNPQSVIYQ